MQMLIITVYVTMFVQCFEKIEPPIKEEIGYIYTYTFYNHYRQKIILSEMSLLHNDGCNY